LTSCRFEEKSKTGGVSPPTGPTHGRIFIGVWASLRLIKFRVLWIVFIPRGSPKRCSGAQGAWKNYGIILAGRIVSGDVNKAIKTQISCL
jgi:hypothetical protein